MVPSSSGIFHLGRLACGHCPCEEALHWGPWGLVFGTSGSRSCLKSVLGPRVLFGPISLGLCVPHLSRSPSPGSLVLTEASLSGHSRGFCSRVSGTQVRGQRLTHVGSSQKTASPTQGKGLGLAPGAKAGTVLRGTSCPEQQVLSWPRPNWQARTVPVPAGARPFNMPPSVPALFQTAHVAWRPTNLTLEPPSGVAARGPRGRTVLREPHTRRSLTCPSCTSTAFSSENRLSSLGVRESGLNAAKDISHRLRPPFSPGCLQHRAPFCGGFA